MSGLLAALWLLGGDPGSSRAGRPHPALPEVVPRELVEMLLLESKFKSLTISRWSPTDSRLELFYGDTGGVIRHVRYVGDKVTRTWKSPVLEGQMREIFVEDLDRDGDDELVAYTNRRAYVWEWTGERSRELWESSDRDFKTLQAMTIASVDTDAALELVFVADNRLVYYDAVNFVREKEAPDVHLNPTIVLTGNVDRDEALEIITNDGYVFGVRALKVEWATDPFGTPIYLHDLDRDGILDLIGGQRGAVKAWSVAERRQLW